MAEEIWSILEIKPTADTDRLKAAYRKKLLSVHPEDDPKGFMRLRKAYEEAKRLVLRPEDGGADPVAIWMDKVRAVCGSLPRRINPAEWERLLRDEVCFRLDTGMDARNHLLAFLMDHPGIPNEIWLVLDREFGLRGSAPSLHRIFPREYVGFILTQLETPSWFAYSLFEGTDQADYDRFLEIYTEIRKALLSGKRENLNSLFAEADMLSIRHPYLEADRARYLLGTGMAGKALSLARSLTSSAPGDNWLLYSLAEIEWQAGEAEDARIHMEALLKRKPEDYEAMLCLAKYHNLRENYETARDYAQKALRIHQNAPDLLTELMTANHHLIGIYKSALENRPEASRIRMALLECLLQNRRYEEGLELAEAMTSKEKQSSRFLELYARLSCGAGLYPEAVLYTRELIRRRGEKNKGSAYELLSHIYHEMAGSAPLPERAGLLSKALDASGTAISVFSSGSRLLHRAVLCLDSGQYQSCVDVCDRIGSGDPAFLQGCLLRQRAFYHLDSPDEVLDEFYHVYSLSPSCPDIYIYAFRILFSRRRLKEAGDILDTAARQHIQTPELSLERLRLKRYLAGSPSEEAGVISELGKLEERCKKTGAPSRVTALVLHEKALGLMNTGRLRKALQEIERAEAMLPDSLEIKKTKGDILMELGRFQKAYPLYLSCARQCPEAALYQEKAGLCCAGLGKPEKALSFFSEVLRLNPQHPRANSHIVRCCITLLKETEDRSYLDFAVPYAERQLAKSPRSLYYLEAGQLYLEAGRRNEALSFFLSGIRANPANAYAYNWAGCACQAMKRYKEAIRMFEKAVSLLAGRESSRPYRNLGSCLEQTGDYERALTAYERCCRLFPKEAEGRRRMAAVLIRMGRLREALSCLEELLTIPRASKSRTLSDIGKLYLLMGKEEEALSFLKRAVREGGHKDGYAFRCLGSFYLASGLPDDALACYRKALRTGSDKIGDCVEIVKLHSLMGNRKEAGKWFARAMDAIIKFRGSIEAYTDSVQSGPKRLCLLGDLHLYSGCLDGAKAFYHRISQARLCRGCLYSSCQRGAEALRQFCLNGKETQMCYDYRD